MAHLYWRGSSNDKRPRKGGKRFPGDNAWVKYRESGKTICRSLGTKDPKLAKYLVNDIANRIARGEEAIKQIKKVTPLKALEEYRSFKLGSISKSHATTSCSMVERYIISCRIKSLANIDKFSVKEHLNRRIEQEKISHRSANHEISAIRAFLYFCVDRSYLDKNPLARIKPHEKFKVPSLEPRFLDPKEIRDLLHAAKTFESPTRRWDKSSRPYDESRKSPHGGKRETEKGRYYPAILTLLYTGMRPSELKRLNIKEDVNFDRGEILIRLSKPGSFRRLPMHKVLAEELKKNPHIDTQNLEDQFSLIRKASGLRPFRIYDLRHTFASVMINNGVDIRTLKDLMGHRSIKTTMIYAHLYKDAERKAIQRFKF